jgi:hypothetical protein
VEKSKLGKKYPEFCTPIYGHGPVCYPRCGLGQKVVFPVDKVWMIFTDSFHKESDVRQGVKTQDAGRGDTLYPISEVVGVLSTLSTGPTTITILITYLIIDEIIACN